MHEVHDIYLGLGSNLNDPVQQIEKAINALAALPDTHLVSQSDLYRSPPLLWGEMGGGWPTQPDYINAVLGLHTSLEAEALLDHCQQIEHAQGRVRGPQPWSARTLDIDILIFDQIILNTERLTIPHSGLVERNFVLYPLFQIAPDLIIPQHGALADLVKNCPRGALELVSSE